MADKPLEDVIRDLAGKGLLNAVTLTFGEDGWDALYLGAGPKERREGHHEDPVCAIRQALTGRTGTAPGKPVTAAYKSRKPTKKAPKPTSTDDDLLGDL